MAHNLENRDGRTSMMYSGKKPWHGLGQYLGGNNVTAEEAIVAAGMDWEVKTVPLYYSTTEHVPDMQEVPKRKGIVRMDTGDILGVMSNHYKPLQNKDAFKVLDPIVGNNAAVWHTAGVLGKGERIWVSAKLPDTFYVGSKEDRIEQYFLLTNGHDGLSSIQLKFTPVRVVCQNTLQQALIADGNKTVSIKHMGKNMEVRMQEAAEWLSRINGYARIFKEEAEKMYKHSMVTDESIDNFLASVLCLSEDAELTNNKKYIGIRNLMESGAGTNLSNVKGSLWGAYNAVTEYVDHTEHKNQSKWVLTGEGFKLKERAWNAAEELVSA